MSMTSRWLLLAALALPSPWTAAQADAPPAPSRPAADNPIVSQARAEPVGLIARGGYAASTDRALLPSSQGFAAMRADDAGPDTTMSWLMALGFLTVVILRRTRTL